MIQAQEIEIKKLTPNKGQIEGVPTNPRKASKDQIEKLKKSIEETPTMLQLREIIAYDNGGELVIIGGNMRYQALKALGHKTALVKVLPIDTPKETINEFIIKDAGATNRKLGSDMADSVTGGGLHGKDLSKADVSVNIYCFLEAQRLGKEVKAHCAIGDDSVNGIPYTEIVEKARQFITNLGGFEKFAEWGLY